MVESRKPCCYKCGQKGYITHECRLTPKKQRFTTCRKTKGKRKHEVQNKETSEKETGEDKMERAKCEGCDTISRK